MTVNLSKKADTQFEETAASIPVVYDDDGDPNEDDFEFDCALNPRDGQCGKAGSEECDWDCPMRNSEFFAGSAAWIKKHKLRTKRE